MQLTITRLRPDHGRHVLRPTGDIDLAVAEQLRDALTAAVADNRVDELIVDLSAVTFLDCTGITALLAGEHVARRQAKPYAVVGASGIVLRILHLAEVLPLLTHASQPPAFAALAAR